MLDLSVLRDMSLQFDLQQIGKLKSRRKLLTVLKEIEKREDKWEKWK